MNLMEEALFGDVSQYNPVYIDINNVERWLMIENPQDEFELHKDFPSLVNPWDCSVYEWTLSSKINKGGVMIKSRLGGLGIKDTVFQDRILDGEIFEKTILDSYRKRMPSNTSALYGNINNYHFIVQHILQVSKPSRLPLGMVTLFLNKLGTPIGNAIIGLHPSAKHLGITNINGSGFDTLIYPVFFAISFLHCKNVHLHDRPISRQIKRKCQRRGIPLVKYKELIIEPFKKQVRYESRQTGESEMKRALHICRGHFATYTDDKPLFGKHTGTFWKPMHTRGNKSIGEIKKSYKIIKEIDQ